MDLPFELFVAVRYLLARRKQAFISLISLISVLGVAVGVMALLIALALMTGPAGGAARSAGRIDRSRLRLQGRRHPGSGGRRQARCEQIPDVIGAAPVVLGQGMIQAGAEEAFISIKGIVPELEPTVTNVSNSMQSGSLAALAPTADGPAGIVLGADLADKLGVRVGDVVQIMTPKERLSPLGMMPKQRKFKVVGIFKLGLYEFDYGYGFVHIDVAKIAGDETQPTFIELRVRDLFKAQDVADQIPEQFGSDYVGAGLGGHEQVALLRAVAREDGDLDHDWPHRDGRCAQHHRVADPARHGEEPRHRDTEDDGEFVGEHPADLRSAGTDHRADWHAGRRVRRTDR